MILKMSKLNISVFLGIFQRYYDLCSGDEVIHESNHNCFMKFVKSIYFFHWRKITILSWFRVLLFVIFAMYEWHQGNLKASLFLTALFAENFLIQTKIQTIKKAAEKLQLDGILLAQIITANIYALLFPLQITVNHAIELEVVSL